MSKPNRGFKKVWVFFPPDQLVKLTQFARLKRTTRSRIMRDAADDHLERLKACIK